ncbi:uncharacterized protein A1O9_11131 [Exophiala aquamarina CBS 119918]|uniref:Vesicle-mediated transporter Vid24 n=1 Tax=Exophiala aquamarina CBS 119918 TaxID=1182545 RepID=A0A072NXV9_9EURO|nr:uncharacterized protein A1O9_11131 [Exophiala aquamarina CBS 119918]KEF52714.1 hypothetical protein A1O9_11131 [Exophiala aquamarina CBS 119918]
MSEIQEESMYTSAPDLEEKLHPEVPEEKMELDAINGGDVSSATSSHKLNGDTQSVQGNDDDAPTSNPDERSAVQHSSPDMEMSATNPQTDTKDISGPVSPASETSVDDKKTSFSKSSGPTGVPPIDRELDWSGNAHPWDFSGRRLRPQYPSATFQPYSVFKGTQQSDRQIYNVEVTILTVDLEQASMSGYLQICGLTPDHPTLTTFFTGEIIGGPDQKYSFRTRDASWGASDKTDLTHWARFAAWRPLSLHAKRNINFVYPMNHEDWWQQEHIFMRWKEHFLVPDYKLKSIQGASFEGFYYICFNQIEGRVSGIYFHSKSEK